MPRTAQAHRTIVQWHSLDVDAAWGHQGRLCDRPSPLRVSAAEWTPSRGRGSVPIPPRVSDVKSGRARPGSSPGRGRRASYAARGPCGTTARFTTPGSESLPLAPSGIPGAPAAPTVARTASLGRAHARRRCIAPTTTSQPRLAAGPACQWHRVRPARGPREQGHPKEARRMPV
jgi:hypothetical protein